MRTGVVIAAAVLAATVASPAFAANKAKPAGACYTPAAAEAEEGLRLLNDLMVVSSVCQDIGEATAIYAGFRRRNQDPILAYQKALIAHFHGTAGFDRWNTSLANASAQREGGNQQLCQQSAALLQQAKGLDPQGYRAYASSHAAAAADRYPKCK
jgi:hypothetical protein